MNANRRARRGTACAVCKYQRRKCEEDCQLAPYFPAEKYPEFQNAVRVYGVSKIVQIMGTVEPEERPEAARSILAEGNEWARDPVRGCLGAVRDLQKQIKYWRTEYEFANQYLTRFKNGNVQRVNQQGSPNQKGGERQRSPSNPSRADLANQPGFDNEPPAEGAEDRKQSPYQVMDLNEPDQGGGCSRGFSGAEESSAGPSSVKQASQEQKIVICTGDDDSDETLDSNIND